MCAQINLELDKIRSLPEIADVELYLILSEMVREGTLVASVHKCRIGDPPVYVNVTKFLNAPGSEPPTPPRDDPEDSREEKLTPAHT